MPFAVFKRARFNQGSSRLFWKNHWWNGLFFFFTSALWTMRQKHHGDGRVTYYHRCSVPCWFTRIKPRYSRRRRSRSCNKTGIAKTTVNVLQQCDVKRTQAWTSAYETHCDRRWPGFQCAAYSLLQKLNLHFILAPKKTDHQFLFDWVNTVQGVKTDEFIDGNGIRHSFPLPQWRSFKRRQLWTWGQLSGIYREYHPSGETQHFSWVTDITITPENLMQLMRAGRARWKIENETFNTLKTQGYHFDHNSARTVFIHCLCLFWCAGVFGRSV